MSVLLAAVLPWQLVPTGLATSGIALGVVVPVSGTAWALRRQLLQISHMCCSIRGCSEGGGGAGPQTAQYSQTRSALSAVTARQHLLSVPAA